ncbi:DnaJ-class molecular chaperone [Nocardiopsis mwathae]|uniref:DnaJ-class molecular chaperone n=1 Tax=Nocardiopsis mwathae TaxID=1472723 RepID=A0A7X0D544_9ACTN|nr:hypothetical protein [Nocardiopsis mwathae]MBB6171815.1 DnaJ-class molecular chaperone [Nocardiopsis mwathae]
MDVAIVCQSCQGSGLRVGVVGYAGGDGVGEMVVPRRCADCTGSGRLLTTGWTAPPEPADTPRP